MNFNIDFGTIPLTPPVLDVPLYASIDGRAAALGGDEVVFYDPQQDRNHVMTTQVLQALDLCRSFLPMEQHVQRVCEQLPNMQGQQVAVKRVLDSLAARGLLISDDAFLTQLGQVSPSVAAPCAGWFIRACDRPTQLAALLASLTAHQTRFSAAERVVVVDDSRNAEAVAAHASLLREFAARWPSSVHHLTPALWASCVDQLAAALPEHADALRPLLQRDPRFRSTSGGGIGKNLITLLAAGGRYLLLDDDFLLPLHRHPQARDELAIGEQAWALRSYASIDAALAAGSPDGADPLALQMQLCGRRLGEVLSQQQGIRFGRGQLRGLAPSREPLLRPDSRVALTVSGHRGGSGAAGVGWLLLLYPAARAGYASDDAHYSALRGDPPVWFGCSRFRLSRLGKFTPFAVDNSQLMPCTSPFGRGEDAVFNALVALTDSRAVQLDLPWAIGHRPEAGRDRSGLYAEPETPDLNHCLTELIGHVAADLYSAQPAPRFALMAARLDDLAQGSDATVLSYLREYLGYRRSMLVEQLKRVANLSADAPSAWKADLKAQIEANGRAILERGPPRFAGWNPEASASDCAARFRLEAGVLAAGLRAWAPAWDVALQQRESWLGAARIAVIPAQAGIQ